MLTRHRRSTGPTPAPTLSLSLSSSRSLCPKPRAARSRRGIAIRGFPTTSNIGGESGLWNRQEGKEGRGEGIRRPVNLDQLEFGDEGEGGGQKGRLGGGRYPSAPFGR